MGQVKYTHRIDALPAQVFELGLKAERMPEWFTSIIEVKDITGPLDRIGSGYTAMMKVAGRPLEVRWEVVKIDGPSYTELKGSAPGGGWATYSAKNEPVGTGTEVTLELHYELPGGFLGQFADKLFVERAIERDMKHAAENFKALVEAEVPALV
ncbi:MAG: hypothetical protein A2V85_11605 [Chloroflexi bacterium RBG_16_72_14]|nr:MAG: hypothetical protein A2V85_11605 [Chloroflexi bacterium RBG_16_72_14]